MTSRNLTWNEAVLEVLREVQEPLHHTEIARRIIEQGLKEPIATANSVTVAACRDLRSASGRNGVRPIESQRGWYALEPVANALNRKIIADEAAASGSGILKIEAFGLLWRRDLVNWDTGQNLYGQQNKDAVVVDFADLDGVYFLHDSRREVMYVGKTYTPVSNYGLFTRLKGHNDDPRKTVFWDSFSWFGFKPVSEDGRLLQTPENATFESVIGLIEAIFIETLLPRLNQQSGEGMVQAREDGLYFQATSQTG